LEGGAGLKSESSNLGWPGIHYVAKLDSSFLLYLPQPPECWDYKHVPPCLPLIIVIIFYYCLCSKKKRLKVVKSKEAPPTLEDSPEVRT
jgi:hypothetical protein